MFGHRPVHFRMMPAVKVHRVRMRTGVQERDAQAVAFRRADGRAGHLTVERPGREEHAGRDLDLAIDGDDLILPEQRAVGTGRLFVVARPLFGRQVREVPRAQVARRVERLGRHAPDGPHLVGGVLHRPM